VQIVLFTVLGGCVMVIAYALGIAGPVCALLFLGGVFTGALLQVARPIIDWATKP
jgi:cytochrome c biogenesis protein CcdA